MNKMLVVAVVMMNLAVHADYSTVFDGGWRISAGPVYDPGANASVRFSYRPTYVSPFTPGRSKASARSEAAGTKTSDTRTDFSNGAWIDTYDPVYGDDVGRTRYYGFPGSAYNGDRTFTLGSADYSDVETIIGRPMSFGADDESGMLGVNIELSRNLYHDEDYGWGFDVAFAVQYFKHTGMFSAQESWLNGSSRNRSGRYSSVIDLSNGDYDEWNWHGSGDDAYYGSGDYSGNAGPIDGASVEMDEFEVLDVDSSYGSMSAEGDYENLELMLLGRPYYDIFDWLRVNATLGLVVSRQDLDFTMTMMRDGMVDYRSSRDFSQWDVYGVAGLGVMLYYRDFTLGCDFLTRFLDSDLDFSDNGVSGSVQRGRWMFKISAGYEF